MKKLVLAVLLIFTALFLTSCDNQKAGTFAVKFSWAKDGEGKEVKPDVSTGDFFVTVRIYEWKEGVTFPGDIAANGKQLIQSDPAQMKTKGTSIDFGDLSYGNRRFVVAEIRKGEELTGGVLFTGMSQLFDFKAGKHTEVNVEMSMTGLPGYDENGENTFKIRVFYNESPAERVPQSRVALRFTIRNANSVIIANDLNFEKGTAEIALADLKKIDDTTYEYSPWNFTTGWEEIGDGSYTVFGKLKNNIGQISEPRRADVFLDTTTPVPNITPFKEVAKLGDIIEVRFSFDEQIDSETLVLDWNGLAFELAENKSDKSFTYTYTVRKEDSEIEYLFTLIATDLAGNKTDIIDLGKVRIDKTAPDLSYIAMFKNENEHGLSSNLYLKHGDILRFELELNEEITEIPQLLLGPHKIICEEGEKELSFDCSLTIDKDVTYDVVADISLSFNDIAGNIYSRSIVSGAKIDTQVPQFIFRKNKDPQDYNATDTIVLTITANEPVETITVDDIELNNMFTSWNIEGKNETGTHEVKLKAVDLAGNEQPGFTVGTYKVDADFPTALISAPTPDRISGTGSTAIIVNGFNKPVQSVKLNGTECIGEGAKTCTFDAPFGSGDSVETLSMQLTDFVGNVTNLNAGTVYVDRTPPQIAGDATVIFKKPAGCPLGSVNSITSGSSVDISFIVNEPLKEIGDPLVSAEGEVNIIDFNMTGQIGYFYTFSKETINTEFLTDGTYVFKIEIEDEVGNKNNITLSQGFEIDTAKPDAPFVNEEERIVYRRIPWGSDETGGIKYYSIKADGEVVDEKTAWVYAYDGSDPATASEIGKTVASGGTFSEFELNRSDRTEVYLAAYDSACNRSDVVKVRDVEWIATMGYKEENSDFQNANQYVINTSLEKSMLQTDVTNIPYLNSMTDSITADDSNIINTNSAMGVWTKWFAMKNESPSGRTGQAMTYDASRGETVVFGGNVDGPANDTWEWGGVEWQNLSSPVSPRARISGTMIYNPIKGISILTGGYGGGTSYFSDTWEWDGDGWYQLSGSTSFNPPRAGIAGTYDEARAEIVLFGGWRIHTPVANYNDTMVWHEDSWILKEPLHKPSVRSSAAMAYDKTREVVVMYGGCYAGDECKDTWEWDGTDWRQIATHLSSNPDFRGGPVMGYDPVSGMVLLFGGVVSNVQQNDTWTWDGTTWTKIFPVHAPSARSSTSLSLDKRRDRLVLFGGNSNSGFINDIWEWDGFDWIETTQTEEPITRSDFGMVYDSVRREAVMFGGLNRAGGCGESGTISEICDTTWFWNGSRWKKATPSISPGQRWSHAMAFDKTRAETVLFGGNNTLPITTTIGYYECNKILCPKPTVANNFRDTWVFNGIDWIKKAGPTCEAPGCYVCNSNTCPPALIRHTMAYDSIRDQVVLFGGRTSGDTINSETWVWNGSVWSRASTTGPAASEGAGMAFDSNRGVIVLFGGNTSDMCGGTISTATWEWNGSSWTRKYPLQDPTGKKQRFAMTYDPLRKATVIQGGGGYNYPSWNDTWEYDGINWKSVTYPSYQSEPAPSGMGRSMVYNEALGKILAFGGYAQSGAPAGGCPGGCCSYKWAYEWQRDSGATFRPTQIMQTTAFTNDFENISIYSVSANFIAGATGGESIHGAELLVWMNGEWTSVAKNEGLPTIDEVATLNFTATDPEFIRRILIGEEHSLNFAATSIESSASGTSSVAVDYAEVVVRYRIP